jgi:hypothetical protein
MIKRPNAIMFVKTVQGKEYIFVYVREDGHYLGPFERNFIRTTDPFNLDPFENWLDFIPEKEWVHPVVAERDATGWWFKGFDTYTEVMWEGKSTTLNYLHDTKNLYKFFDFILDTYKNYTEEELIKELNVGKIFGGA